MTYLPRTLAESGMPAPTHCDRVPPQHAPAARWGCSLDLNAIPRDDLPIDPRSWGREEVGTWVARSGGLPERFPMNGKALCLMSKEMFANRVPDLGHRLHLDFRRRLARALTLQELVDKITQEKSQGLH